MSNLVVFDFDGVHTADEVLNKLRALQKDYLIDLEDACVVERDQGGKVHIKQAVDLTAPGAATGGMRGGLLGPWSAFSSRKLAGMALGALAGAGAVALSGSLADYGIRDDFVRKLGETIPAGSSALFVLDTGRKIPSSPALRRAAPQSRGPPSPAPSPKQGWPQ